MSSYQLKFAFLYFVRREATAVAKGLVLEEGEEIPPAMRKKQILKRIREWEKFEANCNMLKVDMFMMSLRNENHFTHLYRSLKKRKESLGNSLVQDGEDTTPQGFKHR